MRVIPKPDGGVRLIHDCSQPAGKSVNDYCTTDWKQTFSRVDDAAALVTEGCYMAKWDLKCAFRSLELSKHSQKVTGFKWQFGKQTVFIKDKRLPFGSKLAPGIFNRLTQASKKQLQSLAGKLNFCASVVYGGRVYSRLTIETFKALKASNHKAKLNDDIHRYLMVAVFHADFQRTVHAFGQAANNLSFY